MRTMSVLWLWLVLAAVLAPATSGARADATFETAGFAGALAVDESAPPRTAVLVFRFPCDGILGNESAETRVSFHVVAAPTWARLGVEPLEMTLPPCLGIGEARATLVATAVPDAPGGAPTLAGVSARWSAGDHEVEVVAPVMVEAAWRGAIVAEAPTEPTDADPQTALVLPLRIENRGNAPTRVLFEVLAKSEDLEVAIPHPLVLTEPATERGLAVLPISFQTSSRNGALDEVATATFRLVPVAPNDPRAQGPPQEVTFRIHVAGVQVPGFEPAIAVALVAALAFLTRSSGRSG